MYPSKKINMNVISLCELVKTTVSWLTYHRYKTT